LLVLAASGVGLTASIFKSFSFAVLKKIMSLFNSCSIYSLNYRAVFYEVDLKTDQYFILYRNSSHFKTRTGMVDKSVFTYLNKATEVGVERWKYSCSEKERIFLFSIRRS
jgi:hypothetical protein